MRYLHPGRRKRAPHIDSLPVVVRFFLHLCGPVRGSQVRRSGWAGAWQCPFVEPGIGDRFG